MDNLIHGNNLALITFRHTRRDTPMRAFAAQNIVDARLLSSESNCYVFPLYLLPTQQTDTEHVQMPLTMMPSRVLCKSFR